MFSHLHQLFTLQQTSLQKITPRKLLPILKLINQLLQHYKTLKIHQNLQNPTLKNQTLQNPTPQIPTPQNQATPLNHISPPVRFQWLPNLKTSQQPQPRSQ